MKYTKSEILLGLLEQLQEQMDISLLEKVQRETGIDLTQGTDEELEEIVRTGTFNDEVWEVINQSHMVTAGHVADKAHALATQAGGHIASGAQGVANLAAANPVAAAGVGLGVAALAAIRARKNAKARAMAAKA